MKKTALFITAAVILSLCLPVFSCALIEAAPKDSDIKVYVYETELPPVTDGIISEGEYTPLNIKKTSFSYIAGDDADWSRVRNTEVKAYGAYCGGTFYFALSAPLAEEYYNTVCEPKNMWAQTALLVSFARSGTTGRNALEAAYRTDGKSYVWRQYGDGAYSADTFSAKYENGELTYEIAVPLSAFGAENDRDFSFCFSLSVGDYYNNRQAYIQLGRGISGFSSVDDADAGKDAALFPTVKLLTDGETGEPEETTAEEEIPQTGIDVRGAVTASCFAALSAAVVFAAFMKRSVLKNKE